MSVVTKKAVTKKAAKKVFTVQYRSGGQWFNGNTYQTREQAEQAAKRSGRDYQIKQG